MERAKDDLLNRIVREVDDAMLHHEFLQLRDGLLIYDPPPPCLRPPDCDVRPPEQVEQAFLARYHALRGG